MSGVSSRWGDSVLVLPEKEIGIVYKPADENGDVTVQVKREKAQSEAQPSAIESCGGSPLSARL